VIIDMWVSVFIVKQQIIAGVPDRDLTRPYIPQLASGKTLPHLEGSRVKPVLNEAFMKQFCLKRIFSGPMTIIVYLD
jgi:hypothetical protein